MKYTFSKYSFLLIIVLFLLSACAHIASESAKNIQSGDIVVLYTNDVHCGADDNIGYSGLISYKNSLLKNTPFVSLVGAGDDFQGSAYCAVSRGEYSADIIKQSGYDLIVPGNHEFDYGLKRFKELIKISGSDYISSNIKYIGSDKNKTDDFSSLLKDHKIISYGSKKVCFIGVSTPESIASATPFNFMDKKTKKVVYSFYGGNSGRDLYNKVQMSVNECRSEGADFVIAVTHLGDTSESRVYSSRVLIENTEGINAVLDGHAHHVVEQDIVKNRKGDNVLLSSTGTKLKYIGQLVISSKGNISTSLIGDYKGRDNNIDSFINSQKQNFEDRLKKVIGSASVNLIYEENGIRLVRNRETNLGDLCADAYRFTAGADIAFANGGGIRTGIKEGNITFGDILSVYPFGNSLCKAEVSGQQILDALEMSYRNVKSDYGNGKNPVGESGGFFHVSGIKFTVDTSVKSDINIKEGMFDSIGSVRRVKDVKILENGVYTPLKPDKLYTLASTDYVIEKGGDGINIFMNNDNISCYDIQDYQVLINYIQKSLNGNVGEGYDNPRGAGRIIIK